MKSTLDKCEELGAVTGGSRLDMPGVYVKPAIVELSKAEEITKTEQVHFCSFNANENDTSEHNKFLEVLRKKTDKEINW